MKEEIDKRNGRRKKAVRERRKEENEEQIDKRKD